MGEVQPYAAQSSAGLRSSNTTHQPADATGRSTGLGSGTTRLERGASSPTHRNRSHSGHRLNDQAALATAAAASLLASTCCLLPLALVSVGFTGAWLANLRVLQPYSPVLIGIAIAALAFAGRSLHRSRSTTSCRVDGGAEPRPFYKATFWLVAALTLILLVTPVVAPWLY
jgi:mercuric ion transport protein